MYSANQSDLLLAYVKPASRIHRTPCLQAAAQLAIGGLELAGRLCTAVFQGDVVLLKRLLHAKAPPNLFLCSSSQNCAPALPDSACPSVLTTYSVCRLAIGGLELAGRLCTAVFQGDVLLLLKWLLRAGAPQAISSKAVRLASCPQQACKLH